MRYIDLTHPITHNMPTYQGDPLVNLFQTCNICTDGYQNSTLQTGMHAGTHIDGPCHMIKKSPMMNEFDVSNWIGPGVLIDLTNNENPITNCNNLNGSIALLYTGFSNQFYESDYYTHYPTIDTELIDFLIAGNVKMIGIDTPSPDYSPFYQHQKILEAGIFIIENLTNLHQLKSVTKFEIIALPLNIRADSSPARVIARFD
jgi:kynurenine formamidase